MSFRAPFPRTPGLAHLDFDRLERFEYCRIEIVSREIPVNLPSEQRMEHLFPQQSSGSDVLDIRPLGRRPSLLGQHHVAISAVDIVGGFRKIPSFQQSEGVST